MYKNLDSRPWNRYVFNFIRKHKIFQGGYVIFTLLSLGTNFFNYFCHVDNYIVVSSDLIFLLTIFMIWSFSDRSAWFSLSTHSIGLWPRSENLGYWDKNRCYTNVSLHFCYLFALLILSFLKYLNKSIFMMK